MALSNKKKSFNVILEKCVKEKIEEYAKEDSRSYSSLINWILKQYIESREGK